VFAWSAAADATEAATDDWPRTDTLFGAATLLPLELVVEGAVPVVDAADWPITETFVGALLEPVAEEDCADAVPVPMTDTFGGDATLPDPVETAAVAVEEEEKEEEELEVATPALVLLVLAPLLLLLLPPPLLFPPPLLLELTVSLQLLSSRTAL